VATIYHIEDSDQGTLRLSEMWSEEKFLAENYTSVFPLSLAGREWLVGYANDANAAAVFSLEAGPPVVSKTPHELAIGTGWDIVRPFTLGDVTYLMCYRRHDGLFSFFTLTDDFGVSPPYGWAHPRDPGLSVGFTTVAPVVCSNRVVMLGYNVDTGNVVLYSVSVVARSSAPNVPPLEMHHVWQRSWAKGWVRFGFFVLGTGTYFLKTNIVRPNVNIDHVLDDPAGGTAEVATHMSLDGALDLTICETFPLHDGDPFFCAYKADGTTTIYRIHGDCRGWTAVCATQCAAQAKTIVPLTIEARAALLFY
jgi:hypothetical protein